MSHDQAFRPPARWRREVGLTLVEVLAAVAILGIALVPMLDMMRDGLQASRRVESASRSLMLAEATYEQLKSRVQSVVPPYGYGLDYSKFATAFPAPDAAFKLTIVDDGASGLRTVQIKVWHDENGSGTVDEDEIPVILHTRIADRS